MGEGGRSEEIREGSARDCGADQGTQGALTEQGLGEVGDDQAHEEAGLAARHHVARRTIPPSTSRHWPVTNDASSEPRNATVRASSSTPPARPRGIVATISGGTGCESTNPGSTAFARTPYGASSSASSFTHAPSAARNTLDVVRDSSGRAAA